VSYSQRYLVVELAGLALWLVSGLALKAASQLVTRSTCHRSTCHPVDSSRSWLVTKRRSTRHKQTSKPYCHSSNYPYPYPAIAAITQNMHKKLSRKQSEQQSTRKTTCDRVNLRPLLKPTSLQFMEPMEPMWPWPDNYRKWRITNEV